MFSSLTVSLRFTVTTLDMPEKTTSLTELFPTVFAREFYLSVNIFMLFEVTV